MASKFRPIFAKNFGKLGMFWKQLSADISADNIGKSGRLSVSADIDFSCIGRSLHVTNNWMTWEKAIAICMKS